MAVVKKFANFVGLEDFVKANHFKIAPIYKDGKKGENENACLMWISEVIDQKSYIMSQKHKIGKISECQSRKYYEERCERLKNIPDFTKDNIVTCCKQSYHVSQTLFVTHDEKIPLQCYLHNSCRGVFYNSLKQTLELRDNNFSKDELSGIEVTLIDEKCSSYRDEMLKDLIEKGFQLPPIISYGWMEEKIASYLRGMVYYSEKSPVAKMYFYWLQDYMTSLMIYHIMTKTSELSKSGQSFDSYNPQSFDGEIDWDNLKNGTGILFVTELTRVLLKLPTFRWQVKTDICQ